MTTEADLDLYRRWQEALARYGVTHHAQEIFRQLERRIKPNALLEFQRFEAVLDQIHDQAYPDPGSRPHRRVGGDLIDPRE